MSEKEKRELSPSKNKNKMKDSPYKAIRENLKADKKDTISPKAKVAWRDNKLKVFARNEKIESNPNFKNEINASNQNTDNIAKFKIISLSNCKKNSKLIGNQINKYNYNTKFDKNDISDIHSENNSEIILNKHNKQKDNNFKVSKFKTTSFLTPSFVENYEIPERNDYEKDNDILNNINMKSKYNKIDIIPFNENNDIMDQIDNIEFNENINLKLNNDFNIKKLKHKNGADNISINEINLNKNEININNNENNISNNRPNNEQLENSPSYLRQKSYEEGLIQKLKRLKLEEISEFPAKERMGITAKDRLGLLRKTFIEGNLDDALMKDDNIVREKKFKFPVELGFLEDIFKHENTPPKDADTSCLFLKLRFSEFLTTYFTLLGMISGVFYIEFKATVINDTNNIPHTGSISQTILMDICLIIVFRYILYLKLKHYLKDFNTTKTLWNTSLWVELLIEIIIALLHPNIFFKDIYFTTNSTFYLLEVEYSINDYLMIVVLIRIYVFLRFLISSSRFFDERAQRVTKLFGGNLSRLFVVKCTLSVQPFLFISISLFPITFMLSYMIKIIESPVYDASLNSKLQVMDFRYFSNCIWYILATMTTVGYGDYYPKTNFGRLVGVFASLTGTLFVSILIIFLQQTLRLNVVECKTVEFSDRLINKDVLKKTAAYFFLNTFKYLAIKKKYLTENKKEDKDLKTLKKIKMELKKIMYERISLKKQYKQLIQNVFSLPDDFEPITLKISNMERHLKTLEFKSSGINKQIIKIKNGVDKLLDIKKQFNSLKSVNSINSV